MTSNESNARPNRAGGAKILSLEAEQCRRRARQFIELSRTATPGTAEQLLRLATEYDQLADELDRTEGIDRQPD